MSAALPFRPLARFDDLVINQVGSDLLVFDQRSNHIHQLDAVNAATWRLCDGQQTAAELARLVRAELGEAVTVASVEMALDQLSEAELLVTPKEATGRRESRRSLLRKAAVGGAMAVPVIVSISAPQAAAAQSCPGGFGTVCPSDDYCCYGECTPGGTCCQFGEICASDGVCCAGGTCDGDGYCCSGLTVCPTDGVCCFGGECDGSGNCCNAGSSICPTDGVCCFNGNCDNNGNCCGIGFTICPTDNVCCMVGGCDDSGMCTF